MIENSLPLVTVIVPCYNHEKYVEKCLDSIFRQTYKDIEVIVVDDCSADSSIEVIKQLKAKYDFNLIQHLKNNGLPKTLNEGIQKASGKYITFIASDDILLEDSIEVRVEWLENNTKYLAVFTDAQIIDENGTLKSKSFIQDIGKITYSSILHNLHKSLILDWCVPGPVFMAAKEAFMTVGLYDEKYIFEDRDMYLKLLAKNTLGFLPICTAKYRMVNNNSSLRYNPNIIDQIIKIEQDHYKNFSGWNKIYLRRKVFQRKYNLLKLGIILMVKKWLNRR